MKKLKIIGVIVFVFTLGAFISFYIFKASKFSKGLKSDITRRDSFLKAKGIRIDSMGNVKYEEYRKIKDSLNNIKNNGQTIKLNKR